MEKESNNLKKLNISAKSFIVSMSIIIGLMILSYILTFVLPAGLYQRTLNEAGNEVIFVDDANPYGIYTETTRDFSFWKFLFSPALCLVSKGSITLIAIIIFLLVIGGVFEALNEREIIKYVLSKLVNKFYSKRYVLLVVLPLIFMLLSSLAGAFEEIIPLVPIMVALAISLGWDNIIGLTFSLVATGCGYAAGLLNPFGTGVAQKVAGVPAFSGIWYRIVVFVLLYALLVGFLFFIVKRYEKKHDQVSLEKKEQEFEVNPRYEKAVLCLGIILGVGILTIISSTFLTFLQDYTLYIFALCFLAAGISSCLISGMKGKELGKSFLKGMVGMLPAALMIICASSIKYILTESNTIDTLLKYLMDVTVTLPKWSIIIFIYLIVLVLEFFVPSGSAKAFLIIPLMVPVAHVVGLSVNLVVLAYIFGDGLANVIYPTNPALLISLNLADSNYATYIKKLGLFFLACFVLTCGLLIFGYFIGYC